MFLSVTDILFGIVYNKQDTFEQFFSASPTTGRLGRPCLGQDETWKTLLTWFEVVQLLQESETSFNGTLVKKNVFGLI